MQMAGQGQRGHSRMPCGPRSSKHFRPGVPEPHRRGGGLPRARRERTSRQSRRFQLRVLEGRAPSRKMDIEARGLTRAPPGRAGQGRLRPGCFGSAAAEARRSSGASKTPGGQADPRRALRAEGCDPGGLRRRWVSPSSAWFTDRAWGPGLETGNPCAEPAGARSVRLAWGLVRVSACSARPG